MRTKPPPSQPGKVVMALHERFSQGAEPEVAQKWLSKDMPTFTVRCVCTDCNAGWMSEIESAAQPILTPMIEGNAVSLTISDQEILAKWLGLKGICAQHALPPGRPRPEWARAYALNKCPPTHWQIRIGKYTGERAAFAGNTGLNATVVHRLFWQQHT
jgi:hypothetical protein